MGAIALVLVSTGYWALAHRFSKRVDADSLQIETVRNGSFNVYVIGNGTVVPRDAEYILARVGGQLIEVNVKSGDSVSRGQVLFTIDNEELMEEFGNKKIVVAEAKAALEAQASAIKTSELQLRRSMLEAESAYNVQNAEFEAYRDLQENKSLPVPMILYKQSEIKAIQLKKIFDLEVEQLKSYRSSMKTELDQYKARLELAENIFARTRERVDGLKMKAKTNGVIQDVEFKPGQRVEVGTLLGLITNPNDVYVRLKLPAVQGRMLALGQKAIIRISSEDRTGKIVRIDPNVKGTTIDVDVDLSENANLRSNMFLSGKVVVQEVGDALFVDAPPNVVENGTSSIYRVTEDGEHLQLVKVKTGLLSAGQVQVQAGLNAGDRIVVSDTSKFDGAERVDYRQN